MKTFGKKLFSLMLAVLMLVGAMPLAAMADEADVQADAGTPVVVDDGTNTYEESGSSDEDAAYQDAGNFNVDCRVIIVCDNYDGPDGTLIKESDNKKVSVRGNYDTLTEKEQLAITKTAYSNSKLANSSMYTYDAPGVFDSAAKTFTITVNYKTHDCNKYKKYKEIVDEDEYHTLYCAICGAEDNTSGHNYKVQSKNELQHVEVCSLCGHKRTVAHTVDFYKTIGTDVKKGDVLMDGDEEVTVTVAATDATCERKAKYASVKYACGFTVSGEEYGSLAEHTYNTKDVCIVCGHKKDGEETYNVSIVLTRGSTLVTGTAKLTLTEINSLTNNESSAKKVLAKTVGATDADQKIIDAYAKKTYFSNMGRLGKDIEILVTEDLSKTITDDENKTVEVTVYGTLVTNDNGQLVEDETGYSRILNVGESYFNQIKQTDPTGKRTLVSMKIYKGDGSFRTIDKNTSNVSSKVQSDDAEVHLIWSAKKVTVKFYRTADSNDSNGLVATRVMRAGEIIDNLPTLDGQEVNWYLENGQLLQEQSVFYDFNTDVIRAYPGGSSGAGVYLFIYQNGNTTSPISNEPVSITKFVSSKGFINTSELTSTIEKAVGKKNLKITGLFDYTGWSDYVQTKSTTKAYPNGYQVGVASERTCSQFLYVMVNAGSSSSSSSKADSSNPKTGDTAMIGTAFAVLSVAALGLCTATVVLKKKEEF